MSETYAKKMKQAPSDRGIKKFRKYLKSNRLVAIAYGKGVSFCVMKKNINELFKKKTIHLIVKKIEIGDYKELSAMWKKTK